jgi:hypothetical protein
MNFPNDREEEGLSRELEKALFDFEDYYSGLISSEKDTYEVIFLIEKKMKFSNSYKKKCVCVWGGVGASYNTVNYK